ISFASRIARNGERGGRHARRNASTRACPGRQRRRARAAVGGTQSARPAVRHTQHGGRLSRTAKTSSSHSPPNMMSVIFTGRRLNLSQEIFMKIANAVALVTGANRGIGLAFTRALLARGARKRGARKVYAGARDPSTITEPDVEPIRLDVTKPDEVAAAAARARD